jgi:hypothetical protein
MAGAGISGERATGWWPSAGHATAVMLALLLLALAMTPIPAQVDYVNHLARMGLLAAPGPHPAYVVTWSLTPNLAMDIIVPALARVMPVADAARLFLALTWGVVVSGAIALERAVKGRHVAAGLCAVPVLFSLPFAWGLGNSNLGLGLAVWGVALWVRLAEALLWRRWLVHCAVTLVLFFTHFFALGCYGVVIGLIELARLAQGRLSWRRAAVLALLLAAPVAVLLALMRATGGTIGGQLIVWDWAQKAHGLVRFWNGADARLALVSALVVVLLIGFMVARHQLQLTQPGRWVAGGLALLWLALPWQLFDIAFLDVRVLALAALVVPAFLAFTPSRAGAVVLVGLALVNGAVTVAGWAAHQADYRAFQASFAALPRGAAVLTAVTADSDADDAPLYYAPALAVPARGVFVASFYAFGGAQPVAVAPRYADRAPRAGMDYLPVLLPVLLEGDPPPHARNWRQRYDYLYVIGPVPDAPPQELQEVAAGRRFRLYRITRP